MSRLNHLNKSPIAEEDTELEDPIATDLDFAMQVHQILSWFSRQDEIESLIPVIKEDYGNGPYVESVIDHHLKKAKSVLELSDTIQIKIPEEIGNLIRRYLFQVEKWSPEYKRRFQDVIDITGVGSRQIDSLYAWIKYGIGKRKYSGEEYFLHPSISRHDLVIAWANHKWIHVVSSSNAVWESDTDETCRVFSWQENELIHEGNEEKPEATSSLHDTENELSWEEFRKWNNNQINTLSSEEITIVSETQEQSIASEYDEWFGISAPEKSELEDFIAHIFQEFEINTSTLRAILGRTGRMRPNIFNSIINAEFNAKSQSDHSKSVINESEGWVTPDIIDDWVISLHTENEVINPSDKSDSETRTNGETRIYDEAIKVRWRKELYRYIEERTTPQERASGRVFCLPGVECREILEIYLALGYKPENIVWIEKASEEWSKEKFLKKAKEIGFQYHIGLLEDFDFSKQEPFDVVSLDFPGPHFQDFSVLLRKIPVSSRAIVITNFLGKRETKTSSTVMKLRGHVLDMERDITDIFNIESGKEAGWMKEDRDRVIRYDLAEIGSATNKWPLFLNGKLRVASGLRKKGYINTYNIISDPSFRFSRILYYELVKLFEETFGHSAIETLSPFIWTKNVSTNLKKIEKTVPRAQFNRIKKDAEKFKEELESQNDSSELLKNAIALMLNKWLEIHIFGWKQLSSHVSTGYINSAHSPFLTDMIEVTSIQQANSTFFPIIRVFLECFEVFLQLNAKKYEEILTRWLPEESLEKIFKELQECIQSAKDESDDISDLDNEGGDFKQFINQLEDSLNSNDFSKEFPKMLSMQTEDIFGKNFYNPYLPKELNPMNTLLGIQQLLSDFKDFLKKLKVVFNQGNNPHFIISYKGENIAKLPINSVFPSTSQSIETMWTRTNPLDIMQTNKEEGAYVREKITI